MNERFTGVDFYLTPSSAILAAEGVKGYSCSLALTSFAEDTAAVERSLERLSGPVVLGGDA